MTRAYHVFATAHGACGIGWSATGVARFQLPGASPAAVERMLRQRLPGAEAAAPPPAIGAVIEQAVRYFAGAREDFSAVTLDLAGQEPFFAAIYAALRQVPWGETTTYGALAGQLGTGPEAAREVGQAMARNPVPLIIPCHRVLAAGGKVGGFSAPGGAAAKLRMLALEGVQAGPAQGTLFH